MASTSRLRVSSSTCRRTGKTTMMSSISAANADEYNIDEYLQVAFKLDGRRLGQYSNGSLV